MEITTQMISQILADGFRRCEMAKLSGGIPHRDAVEGKPVPTGWVLDPISEFWVDPSICLDTVTQ